MLFDHEWISKSLLLSCPKRLKEPDSWVGHIPFAFFCVSVVKPKLFVELGTHTGNSYFTFCQSAVEHNIDDMQCFAVDTWQGDEHAGKYNDAIFKDVNHYNNTHYSGFSTLIRSTFDEALSRFDNESVDLLHIDGLHTYEAVKHDFDTWLPKMSKSGVVLFHDISVRDHGFGVWKLWDEIKDIYPSFSFHHSYGLGVVLVGKEPDSRILEWFESVRGNLNFLQDLLSTVGYSYNNQLTMQKVQHLAKELDYAVSVIQKRDEQLTSTNNQLQKIGDEHSHAQSIVKERDETIQNLSTELQRIGDAHTHAQGVVRQRDLQILTLEESYQKITEEKQMLEKKLKSNKKKFFIFS